MLSYYFGSKNDGPNRNPEPLLKKHHKCTLEGKKVLKFLMWQRQNVGEIIQTTN